MVHQFIDAMLITLIVHTVNREIILLRYHQIQPGSIIRFLFEPFYRLLAIRRFISLFNNYVVLIHRWCD